MDVLNTIGRRKTSITRVYIKEGKGKITVNHRDYKQYFKTEPLQYMVNQAFEVTDTIGKYDVHVIAKGGGITGQAQALRLGIARALVKINQDYRTALKAEGLLRRDPRMVERKKPGRPKARKKFQFSKR